MRSLYFASSFLMALSSPALAEHFMDHWPNCPIIHMINPKNDLNDPNCPPADTVIWTYCPTTWPKTGNYPLTAGYSFSGHYNVPDFELYGRDDINEGAKTAWIDCDYGPRDKKYNYKYHVTLLLQLPIVQCVHNDSPKNHKIGCSTPKSNGPLSEPQIYIAEPLTEQTILQGFGLGQTLDQVNKLAADQGYSITPFKGKTPVNAFFTTGEHVGFYRVGTTALSIIFDPITHKAKEIILTAGWQDDAQEELYRMTVKRFGLGWKTDGPRTEHFIWSTPDQNTVLEYWSDNRPQAPASLHLIDKRDLNISTINHQ